MIRCELNIICYNKTGHAIRRYMWVYDKDEAEYEIKHELEKYKAIYEYIRIQKYRNRIIATACNCC